MSILKKILPTVFLILFFNIESYSQKKAHSDSIENQGSANKIFKKDDVEKLLLEQKELILNQQKENLERIFPLFP